MHLQLLRFHNAYHFKVFLYLLPFGRNSNIKFWPPPQFDTHLWVRMDLGVENGTNRNIVPTFLFEFYTHRGSILHRLATIHNAADRQPTDRAMGKDRRCYRRPKKQCSPTIIGGGRYPKRLITWNPMTDLQFGRCLVERRMDREEPIECSVQLICSNHSSGTDPPTLTLDERTRFVRYSLNIARQSLMHCLV